MKDRSVVLLMMLGVLAGVTTAGVLYLDPPSGWAYLYDGVGVANAMNAALDGTWDHDNGSDEWDGTAIGAGKPGGVNELLDGATTYIRIQDTGDPMDYGIADPSNRKIMFCHNVNNDIGAAGNGILTNGVTISFRARIATGAPLDKHHPNGGGGIVDWPAGGLGTTVNSDGKGNFSVRQNTGDSIITFSLALKSDHTAMGGVDGLIMNNLNGTSAKAAVDTGEAGTVNVLPVQNITDWHEFWITIQPDTSGGGTHKVLIYMDGSYAASEFHVTAGTGNDEGWNYIAMGMNMTNHAGAYDIDFFGYVPGVMPPPDPTFNPAPEVDATPNMIRAIRLGESVQLNATVTDKDPQQGEPGNLTWYWYKASGPGTATFTPADTTDVLNPTVTFSAKGIYELMLQATDGSKDANDIVRVWVKDRADEKLVAHYPLEGNGNDIIGGRHLIARGDTTYVDPGAIGKAASFDGAGDDMVQTDPNLAVGNIINGLGALSISCWVKSDIYDTDKGFIIFQTPAGNDDMDIRYDEAGATGGGDAVLKMGVTTTGGIRQVETSSRSQTTNWQHVVMTWERGAARMRAYIDGIEEVYTARGGAVDAVLTGFGSLILGRGGKDQDPNTGGWDGLVDDVRIYNHALALTDAPQYTSVRTLTAMGPVVARVDAGSDVSLNWKPGAKVALDGSVTDYGRPSATTIMWSTESGPGQAVFDDPMSPVTMVSFPTDGVYVLKLTVVDGDLPLEPIEDTITATVNAPTCADVIADGKALVGDISGPDLKGTPDCRVDLYDFVFMAEYWLRCNDPRALECEYPY